MEHTLRRSLLSGTAIAPPSPAAAHRALFASMLSQGQSVISNIPASPEMQATLRACRAFGADIVSGDGVADVFGADDFAIPGTVDCAQSNTTLKMFLALAANLEGRVSFTGQGRLAQADLSPWLGYLSRLGADVQSESGHLPATVGGPLFESEMIYFTPLGPQLFSGLLMCLPIREQDSEIGIDSPFPDPRFPRLACGIMEKCGIRMETSAEGDYIYVPGGQDYLPLGDYAVPASAHAVSYLLLAGALCGKVAVKGAGEDSRLSRVFSPFGARLSFSDGLATASASSHHGAELFAPGLGEFLPHALALAASSPEQTKISGISQLSRPQERRLRLLLRELSKMGLKSEEEGGSLLLSGGELSGAEITPEGEPAVAMICSIAALCARGQTRITESEIAERSFPGFYSSLASLGALIR